MPAFLLWFLWNAGTWNARATSAVKEKGSVESSISSRSSIRRLKLDSRTRSRQGGTQFYGWTQATARAPLDDGKRGMMGTPVKVGSAVKDGSGCKDVGL